MCLLQKTVILRLLLKYQSFYFQEKRQLFWSTITRTGLRYRSTGRWSLKSKQVLLISIECSCGDLGAGISSRAAVQWIELIECAAGWGIGSVHLHSFYLHLHQLLSHWMLHSLKVGTGQGSTGNDYNNMKMLPYNLIIITYINDWHIFFYV